MSVYHRIKEEITSVDLKAEQEQNNGYKEVQRVRQWAAEEEENVGGP